jgi:NAD-dependent DNA ligase
LTGLIFALGSELKEFFAYMFSGISSVSDLIDTAKQFAMDLISKLPQGVGDAVGSYVVDFFDKIGTQNLGFDMSVLSAPISGAWNVVKGIPSLFLSLLVTIVSCVFMTADYEIIKKTLETLDQIKLAEAIKVEPKSTKYADYNVCFTGVRSERLVDIINSNGGHAGDNWTKAVNLLIAKDPTSTSGKAKKAREKGIRIISLQEAEQIFVD